MDPPLEASLLFATLKGILWFVEATCAGVVGSACRFCWTLLRTTLAAAVALGLTFAWDAMSLVAMSDAVSCVVALAALSIFCKRGLAAKMTTLAFYAAVLGLTAEAVRKPCAAEHVWELRAQYASRGRDLLKTGLWMASTVCTAVSATVHGVAMWAHYRL